MTGTPLFIGPAERDALNGLREKALQQPADMTTLPGRLKTPEGKHGHPGGTMIHMSMSAPLPGRLPSPHAVWMVAELLGFHGSLGECVVWIEELEFPLGPRYAAHIVQPFRAQGES